MNKVEIHITQATRGLDGLTAYELAVARGLFVGTEAQYLQSVEANRLAAEAAAASANPGGEIQESDPRQIAGGKVFAGFQNRGLNGYTLISNQEYIIALVDSADVLLWAKRRDGSTYDCDLSVHNHIADVKAALELLINSLAISFNNLNLELSNYKTSNNARVGSIEEKTNRLSIISNLEYAIAYTDEEGHLLWGKRWDGTTDDTDNSIYDFVQKLIDGAVSSNTSRIDALEGRQAAAENLINKQPSPEFLKVETDEAGNVIAAIRKDGVNIFPKTEIDECKVKSLEVENYNLTDANAKKIEEALKRIGFKAESGDWTESEFIHLPIPREPAIVNIISSYMPTTKTDDIPAVWEYRDNLGNYFKADITLNAQGSSSMAYIKKNLSVDFNDKEIKFGGWVPRDSFHVKAYYIDAFVGQCIVSYQLGQQIKDRMPWPQQPYQRYEQSADIYGGTGNLKSDFGSGGLCQPDGFPLIIYHNGVYNGLYVLALSKHRSNYNLDKDNTDHVFLDGALGTAELWNGSVDWTQFEVRNPSGLKDTNEASYDSDNPKELSNTHPKSVATKEAILRLSGAMAAISAASGDDAKRSIFEQYFLVRETIQYFLHANWVMNFDGFRKNWLWTTYDGWLWIPNIYDNDSIFSMFWRGNYIDKTYNPSSTLLGTSTSIPTGRLYQLYRPQIEAMYADLRRSGVLSVENTMRLMKEWADRIGANNYADNFERWPEIPSYRASYIDTDHWEQIAGTNASSIYSASRTYAPGETCYHGSTDFHQFRAKISTQGNPPYTQFRTNTPHENGFYNSLDRIRKWMEIRVNFLDSHFNYES